MKKLSETQQNRLKEAINEVMDSYDIQSNPNELIAKTAQNMKLSRDYIPLLVNAYNTGVQGVVRSDGTTIAEKTASFPLASTKEIDRILYPSVKEKKASYDDTIDDFFDYSAKAHFSENPLKEWGNYTPPIEKAAELKHSDDKVFELERRAVEKVDTLLKQARAEKYDISFEMDSAFSDLERELHKYTAPSVADFTKFAEASFGKLGKQLAEIAIKRFNFTKKSSAYSSANLNVNNAIYGILDKLVKLQTKYASAHNTEYKCAVECTKALAPIAKERITANYGSEDDPNYLLKRGELYREKEADLPFESPLLQGGVTVINPVIAGSSQDALSALFQPDWSNLSPFAYNIMRAMQDPMHEAKMRGTVINSLVVDLCNTDPYLKKQDPEAVMEALSDILAISPGIHNKRIMLVAALRQYMETGGFDMTTTRSLADAMKSIEQSDVDQRKALQQELAHRTEHANDDTRQREMEKMRQEIDKENRKIERDMQLAMEKQRQESQRAITKSQIDSAKELAEYREESALDRNIKDQSLLIPNLVATEKVKDRLQQGLPVDDIISPPYPGSIG